jgi:hypothetical protein
MLAIRILSGKLLNMLMTTTLAARRLGVAHERLLDWVARKLVPIAGEDEEGRVLLREHVVLERGEALAAEMPERLRSPRLRQLWASAARPRVLSCGCADAADATLNSEPLIRCADAHALAATLRLAEAFAAAAPGEPFFRRLAEVARDALASHLAGSGAPNVEAQCTDNDEGEAERSIARCPSPSRGEICMQA